MKITRRQLRRIIRENFLDTLKDKASDFFTGDTTIRAVGVPEAEEGLRDAIGVYITSLGQSNVKDGQSITNQDVEEMFRMGGEKVNAIVQDELNQSKNVRIESFRHAGNSINEYGNTLGKVSWYEDDVHEVVFDVEGYGERLTQDAVWDIANDAGDEEITTDIQAAVEDWEDYMYSS